MPTVFPRLSPVVPIATHESPRSHQGREYIECMRAKRHVARLLVLCFSFTLSAVAQLDSAALHAKFGMPLNRETFHMAAGFDLVVDYGANSQVCKLHVPALMPSTERVSYATVMKQRMYCNAPRSSPPAFSRYFRRVSQIRMFERCAAAGSDFAGGIGYLPV
jgi:hypothetical protein